jgi:hypothetical protein
MVIEDFAPMRMIPSTRAPRKAHAPLGLVMETRRTAKGGQFVEATNGEKHPFEEPAWLHYWLLPPSILAEPGETQVDLELIVRQEGDAPAALAGRRYSVMEFLSDSTALPDTYHVAAADPEDRSHWGGGATIFPPRPEPYDPPGLDARKAALREADAYRLAVSLSGDRAIASVKERIAAARILVREARCANYEYVETEIVTLAERKRTIGGRGDTSTILVPVSELTTTASAAQVLWTRLVYVADVFFADGGSETVARRLVVTWPLCP